MPVLEDTARREPQVVVGVGLLDRRGVEAEVAREEMERLTREGMPRCRAMEEIAERLCCSYEKIRGFIYSK